MNTIIVLLILAESAQAFLYMRRIKRLEARVLDAEEAYSSLHLELYDEDGESEIDNIAVDVAEDILALRVLKEKVKADGIENESRFQKIEKRLRVKSSK